MQRPTQGPEHNRALLLLTSQRSILWQKGLQSVTCEFRQLYVTTCMWVQEYTMYPDINYEPWLSTTYIISYVAIVTVTFGQRQRFGSPNHHALYESSKNSPVVSGLGTT